MDKQTSPTLGVGVTVSSSLPLFRFLILVFHLKKEHEEGQRLLHYLQQKNDPLARYVYVRVRSHGT